MNRTPLAHGLRLIFAPDFRYVVAPGTAAVIGMALFIAWLVYTSRLPRTLAE